MIKMIEQKILDSKYHKILTKIMITLLKDNKSEEFREPVDWKDLELLNYLDIIKKPMDL